MSKNLKANDVIDMISKKVSLKRDLRTAKKSDNEDLVLECQKKIEKIEKKLSSKPLQKT